jgi:hypothetical protein
MPVPNLQYLFGVKYSFTREKSSFVFRKRPIIFNFQKILARPIRLFGICASRIDPEPFAYKALLSTTLPGFSVPREALLGPF